MHYLKRVTMQSTSMMKKIDLEKTNQKIVLKDYYIRNLILQKKVLKKSDKKVEDKANMIIRN